MASYSSCMALFCLMALLTNRVAARQFTVGGGAGWVPPASGATSYNDWAGKNRFLIGDAVVFKYNPSEDSVVQVSADDYNSCSTSNPIASFKDGNTVFSFPRHGPFYFISGNSSNCNKGEKLIVVVLSPRNSSRFSHSPSPAPATVATPSPAPTTVATPSPSPVFAAPSPAPTTATAPSPSPVFAAPSPAPTTVTAPSPSPVFAAPSPAPTTVTTPSPSPAPTTVTSPSPAPTTVATPSVVPSMSPVGGPSPFNSEPLNTSPSPAPAENQSGQKKSASAPAPAAFSYIVYGAVTVVTAALSGSFCS